MIFGGDTHDNDGLSRLSYVGYLVIFRVSKLGVKHRKRYFSTASRRDDELTCCLVGMSKRVWPVVWCYLYANQTSLSSECSSSLPREARVMQFMGLEV